MNNSPVLVVMTADWHTNSMVGLNPLRYRRERGSEWSPGKAGRAKWRAWTQFWKLMAAKKAEHNAICYAFGVGDLGDMNRRSALELVSSNEPDVSLAIADVGEPMTQVADVVFIYRGTAAHNGGNGKLEEDYAKDIEAEPDRQRGHQSWFAGRHELGGVIFEVTHHPPTKGFRPWTREPGVSRAAIIIASRYMKQREADRVPDVCVWAHCHYKAQAMGLGIHGFFLPPWQTRGEYGYRLGQGELPEEVGGLWFLCQDGKYTWGWETWVPERLTTWQPTT